MSSTIEWWPGAAPSAGVQAALEAAVECELRGETPAADVLGESARRRVFEVATPEGGLVLKCHRPGAATPLRDTLRRPFTGSPARREWRALSAATAALRGAENALPRPVAWLQSGAAEFVVSQRIEGQPLLEVLRAAPAALRRKLLQQLGRALHELARAGVAHGDLHCGNVLVAASAPVFLDWQQARVGAPALAISRDLASLEFSLARGGLRRSERMHVRRAALGEPDSKPDRLKLFAAGELADDFAHDHYRGRSRRAGGVGRRFAALAPAIGRGLRLAHLTDATIAEAIAEHDRALADRADPRILKDDDRSRVTRVALADGSSAHCILKEVTKGGFARQLADPLRGSPARRGWMGGHGLLARGLRAAVPLAYAELGARRSLLILEDASALGCLEVAAPAAGSEASEGALADGLLALLLALHRRGVDHGDLQASHLFGSASGGRLQPFTLIDLEGVRFARRLSDTARLRALAELNASLGEERLSNALRLRIFACYARALPFSMPREEALREVVRRSKARRHRWAGTDCD